MIVKLLEKAEPAPEQEGLVANKAWMECELVQFPPQSCPECGFQERSSPLGSRVRNNLASLLAYLASGKDEIADRPGTFPTLVTRKRKLDFVGVLGSPPPKKVMAKFYTLMLPQGRG